jgi:BlaI family penicillinase repressor
MSRNIWFYREECPLLFKKHLYKRTTLCYTFIVNTVLYVKEVKPMVQQISDAELEIMKIVWGNPDEVTLFPYIMDGLAARGKPCQKNTLIVLLSRLMNKGFLSAKKIGRRNEYTTLVSETEYRTAQTKNFLDKIYEGSAKGLVSNLILGDLLADEEYEELKRLLEKGKGQQ